MKGITLRDYIDMYCHFCWEMSIAANALVNLLFVCLFKKRNPWNLKKKKGGGRGLVLGYITSFVVRFCWPICLFLSFFYSCSLTSIFPSNVSENTSLSVTRGRCMCVFLFTETHYCVKYLAGKWDAAALRAFFFNS